MMVAALLPCLFILRRFSFIKAVTSSLFFSIPSVSNSSAKSMDASEKLFIIALEPALVFDWLCVADCNCDK
jgi:hypothetical protein